ncbi:MAG: phosphomannomutase/phosphoglucomutase [Candidatus Tectomicrobia bacterium]|uniref:Phosphomannomutase/phosphoglucomutase n=1 Tax=Tectimicrobiota bacterium TaxID=2528274 RepID=A0A932ZT77_UNCTE|nr:phosphomannomutase/phosphoglucomutase [Candidatus Tectomicrobia bacterium]MBI4251652.1 phosphomannomutase/phosphoglucomutase [Candidatus Tectomicrobia bacterium]
MELNPRIFREYDIRGVVDRDLSPAVVRLIGRSIGTHLGGAQGVRVALGRDNRLSSPAYYRAMGEGLCAAGCSVTGIGMVPTPCLSFATHHLAVQGGVQITGSHNPPEFNGFKVTKGLEAIHGEEILHLYHLIRDGKLHKSPRPGGFEEADVQPAYVVRASQGLALGRPVKVVIDAGNGIGGPVATRVLQAIGAEVTGIFTEPDGTYPNHHPDPTIPGNLKSLIAKVQETGAEVGIGLDGDGDRIGVVDPTGRIIWGDELLILYSEPILARRPGEAIVFDVKCSSRLAEAVRRMGGRPVMSATGHSLIRARLVAEKAPLAGELSGHIFFADGYLGYDDAIYAAARLLHLLGSEKRTLAERMREIPPALATPELRIDCTDEEKFPIVEELKAHFRSKYETIEVDGVRVNFPKGWGLVRASNTQPVLVLRFEAADEASLKAYQEEVFGRLRQFPSVKVPNA